MLSTRPPSSFSDGDGRRSSALRHAASAPGVGRYSRTSWVARSRARSSASPPPSDPRGPGLHQHVAQRRRLDRAGQHRQPAGVGGELAEQRVARSAADDVHDLDVPAGQLGGPAHGAPVGQRQAVEDAAHRLGLALRRRLPGPRAGLGDAGRHVAGRQERGSSASTTAVKAGTWAARGEQLGQVGGQPGGRPGAQRLLQQPQAHDVAQVADRAVDAELVGEARAPGSPRSAPAASSSTPTSDQVPQEM